MTGSHRILLVEDDVDQIAIYSTLLRHIGYDFVVVEKYSDALKAGMETSPDLVVADIKLGSEKATGSNWPKRSGATPVLPALPW